MEYPFAGSRMLRGLLRQEGSIVGRLHVATLMKQMGMMALYRRPTTSHPTPGHQIYPYLLRKVAVTKPNQVWAMDITYVPMARGFVYLVAVVDWFSRKVLAWRLSITLYEHGSRPCRTPRLRSAWTARARGRDNVFVERLWRTIKYEEVYLRAYRSVSEARRGLGHLAFYNRRRPHSSLGGQTPDHRNNEWRFWADAPVETYSRYDKRHS